MTTRTGIAGSGGTAGPAEERQLEIGDLLLNAIGVLAEHDHRARYFGTDVVLYHSEIHLLQEIGDHPDWHIAALARILGVSRGAASQTVNRLERKQMLVKIINPQNARQILLRLTEKGKTAYTHHKRAHQKYNTIVAAVLADANAEQRRFLREFLLRFRRAVGKK